MTSSLNETELNLLRDGYVEYRIDNEALRLIVESGGDLLIQRVRKPSDGAFRIADTEDTDWLEGLSIREVGHD